MSLEFFRRLGSFWGNEETGGPSSEKLAPSVKLQTDKEVYRPGDTVLATIEICNPTVANADYSLLVENLKFEIKGVGKLDPHWFTMQKPSYGLKQRRGECIFLDCTTPSVVSKLIVSSGCTKTYMFRMELPKHIPPSYRGTTVRYMYYVRSMLLGHWLALENGHLNREPMKDLVKTEVHVPLQIWVNQKSNGMHAEDGKKDGNFPSATIQMDIYWKEKEGDSEWVRSNELDGIEEGYDSSKDEIASVSSYNPSRGNLSRDFGSSFSLQSQAPRPSNREGLNVQVERLSVSSCAALPQLLATEVLHDSSGDVLSPGKRLAHSSAVLSPGQQRNYPQSHFSNDDGGAPSPPGPMEPVASEGFIRGRSYNIRMDDQVLLRFSPKNSDSTYYFGDVIGGTLTFFHEEGTRRCLEVSITLETSESLIQPYIHSQKNPPSITKVQSDHYEVVADLLQTSFLFSIPMDGPMTFSTPHISVRWALRFEFFTTPKNVDWTRYEHPLLINGREKSEWVLPITVHAPPPRPQGVKNEKPLSLGELWVRS
ncbi:hypothetical protein H6P81_021093 [Aristolochia fimbriata]|uniref:Uncharacterized protein n=1 Tax=Aristolochia fimbriata TaxID=158543 RepID=A0AAV7E0J2_ARIFI|nr:hypothetical protein H6P81_021093 [Aristolochia fimbriata]